MILAIDIGNTNIVVGCIDEKKTIFIERLSTIKNKMEIEYALDIKGIFEIHDVDVREVEGAIISSVVPQITGIIGSACEKIINKKAMVVGPGIKTGLNIMIDNPGQLGSDLVADAVAGVAEYKAPMIIFDLGTATTASVINEKGTYIGGFISPGMYTSLNALTANASQLQGISLDAPGRLIGKNTIECMKSGMIYGTAASLDGIITRVEEELGQPVTAIVTGGLAEKVLPFCKKELIWDDDLLLKGLRIIYQKNKEHKM